MIKLDIMGYRALIFSLFLVDWYDLGAYVFVLSQLNPGLVTKSPDFINIPPEMCARVRGKIRERFKPNAFTVSVQSGKIVLSGLRPFYPIRGLRHSWSPKSLFFRFQSILVAVRYQTTMPASSVGTGFYFKPS